MNEAARLALAERNRRRFVLSDADELQMERVAAALQWRRTALPTDRTMPPTNDDCNACESSMDRQDDRFLTIELLFYELQARAALQLLEAVHYSESILQPFASGVVHMMTQTAATTLTDDTYGSM